MTERLNQPYPFYYESTARVSRIAVLLVVIIPIFMLLFTPFDIDYSEHRYPYPLITVVFGVVDSIVFFLTVILLRELFPGYTVESRWTLARELGLWAIVLFVIGIANFLLREFIYINPGNLSVAYLLEEILHSYLVGFLIATLLTLGNFARLILSTSRKATGLNALLRQPGEPRTGSVPVTVTVESETEQDTITFNLADLVYVKVDGNYVEFYLLGDEGRVNRHIKRNTLKNVEQQLEPYSNAVRVHRSYLVNVDHLTSVDGNAQGYRLELEGTDRTIPVSRSYLSMFDAVMSR